MKLEGALATLFDQARGAARGATACPAPLINLHFSQLGVVTACCFNRSFVLGTYPDSSVAEIWEGTAARELRAALAQGDFSKGCSKCWQQIQARDFGGSHAVFYTRQAGLLEERRRQLGLSPSAERDEGRARSLASSPLPLKLEFNVHNACNLQCIMCHGLASSAIRTRREGLSAQPNPYDAAFAEQLAPYLPYVVETDFIGGEPFLVPVYRTIWELLRRVNPRARVCILTNGTILDAGLQELLENINCEIHVSIDSFRADTYERIRRGASLEPVLAHCRYFQALMARRGLPLTWRYCPLRLNWHEIPETLSYCTENGILLFYNQVDSPIGLALTTLPPAELAQVIEALQAQEPRLGPGAVAIENLQHYRELVARLKAFLRPEVRTSALRSRLDTARAVVSQYSRGREDTIRARSDGARQDALTQAVKNLLIARLNVEQALAESLTVGSDARAPVETAEQALLELRADVSFREFVGTYLKELIRTYSGVWGVVEVHEQAVFGHVDAFVAGLREQGGDWLRVLGPEPGAVYAATALGSSVQRLEQWFSSL